MSANLTPTEKQRIHTLLMKLEPVPKEDEGTNEPYPLVMFIFRQIGHILKAATPHVQSLAVSIVEFEKRYNIARGILEMGMSVAERGVDFAIRLGLNKALFNFGIALGRGVGEIYRAYKEG